MSQFRSYPIHIVYSMNSQQTADYQAQGFKMRGDRHMHDWMMTTGRSLMAITPDSAPIHAHERKTYETAITRALESICGTPVGLWVLGSIDRSSKVWIAPDPDLKYVAQTHPAKTVKEGGGIRVHINLEPWGDTLEDVLLHELVHAMRFSLGRYDPRPLDDDFPSSEEFLADQFANVHRSFLGKTRFYDHYTAFNANASKGTLYSKFVETPMQVMALKFCLDHEPIAQRLARLPQSRPDYNPFRDYPTLERMTLGKLQVGPGGAGKLMPL